MINSIEQKINSPLVSVITATYRRTDSLKRALLSVVKQNYKCIEIIIVDDNADKSWNEKVVEIIEEIKQVSKFQIIYIQNRINKGSAETRNIGIHASSGNYITFLDDDDIYLPSKIERQVTHMIELDSDYCITDLELYNERDELIERRNRNYIIKYDMESLLKYHFMYHITGTDALMFKRKYLIKIGCFPLINVGDEFYLMQEAISNGGKFTYLQGCDIKAYVHSTTDNLSSGESKILGENTLYKYKKKFFYKFDRRTINYIKMRHHLVISYTELRRRNYMKFFINVIKGFSYDSISVIKLFTNRKR